MRITYLLHSLDSAGGTERSVVNQANALAAAHDVRIVTAVRAAAHPAFPVDPRVAVDHLVDTSYDDGPAAADAPSLLVPAEWDDRFSARTDVALEERLPDLGTDVLVTTSPALLAVGVQLGPRHAAIVHQLHGPLPYRTPALEGLRLFGPRADLISCPTEDAATWLRGALGPLSPEVVVVPHPLPVGFRPRSDLDQPLIVAAGRLVDRKQFNKLIRAFAEIADEIPEWRLRILGEGGLFHYLRRVVRHHGLWDRVEIPRVTGEMRTEWARASIAAFTARDGGLPPGVQEAMAAGVPVVAVDSPTGLRDLVGDDAHGLLVPPGSLTATSAALLRLATDADLRQRTGAAAFDSARQYAPERVAERWEKVLAGVLDGRPGSRLARRAAAVEVEEAGPVAVPDAPGVTPAQARHAALGAAVTAAAGTAEWFVVRRPAPRPTVLVVPLDGRDDFLARLAHAALPAYLSLVDPPDKGWPERREPVAALAADLRRGRTQRVLLEPWPEIGVLAQGSGVEVQFWERDPDGALVAPASDGYVERVPVGAGRSEIEVEGVAVRTLDHLAGPLVEETTVPVDVVYTWVDGDDAAWNAAREERLRGLGLADHARASTGRARFRSRDELRYSLRSLHLFAPWVRTVHLVTAGQMPAWLDADHPSIRVVDHRDVLPEDALPTFNSHAIETAFARIPDLAEHFLYFNDDFFLGRPVGQELFFSPAGTPAVFASPHPLGVEEPDAPPYLAAGWNNRRLLREAFGVAALRTLAHAPYAHRRSTLEEVERRFPDDVARTARTPFRSGEDVSMLSSLAQHYGLLTGAARVGTIENALVGLGSSDLRLKLRRLLDREQDSFCLADDQAFGTVPEQLDRILGEFLEEYFPVAAPWER